MKVAWAELNIDPTAAVLHFSGKMTEHGPPKQQPATGARAVATAVAKPCALQLKNKNCVVFRSSTTGDDVIRIQQITTKVYESRLASLQASGASGVGSIAADPECIVGSTKEAE
jgi:hypothetical protein